jgi:hypothetical protein
MICPRPSRSAGVADAGTVGITWRAREPAVIRSSDLLMTLIESTELLVIFLLIVVAVVVAASCASDEQPAQAV